FRRLEVHRPDVRSVSHWLASLLGPGPRRGHRTDASETHPRGRHKLCGRLSMLGRIVPPAALRRGTVLPLGRPGGPRPGGDRPGARTVPPVQQEGRARAGVVWDRVVEWSPGQGSRTRDWTSAEQAKLPQVLLVKAEARQVFLGLTR